MAEEINDLNESIRQLTAAISEMAGTFESVAGQSKTASDNLNKMSAGAKNADANVNNMARATISSKGALDQFNTSTQEATEKQHAYKAAQASGIQATLGFADALISTEPGFTKFSGALSAAGDAALTLGKSQGPVGEVLGRIVKAGTMVAEQYLEQADSVFKARNELFKFAGASSMGSNEFLDLSQNLGFTSKQLDSVIKPLRSMGPSLLSLGDSAGEGAKRFLNLSVVSEETRERFIRMGVMPEELLQSQADYINLTRLSGNQASMRLKTDKQIQEESLQYAESLKVLSELTGEDAETVKKRQEAALNDFRFQAKITSMRAEAAAIAESDPEGAKKLLDNAKNMQDSIAIAAALSPELAEQAKSLILTGGNITEFTSNLAVAGVDTQKFAEAMESGDPDAMLNFLQDVMDSTAGQAERFGDMVGYMSDEQLNSLGINRGSMDLLTKYQQEGMNLVDAVAKIKEGLAKTGQAGTDPLADAQANLTTTQMDLAVGFDNLLQETSPLMQGFTAATMASTALAAAAAAAAVALGAIALKRGAGSIFGGGGGNRSGGAPDIPDSASKAVTGLGTGLRSAGMGAVQIALGGAAIGAAIAAIGAGIAGATWLTGKALPTFVEGLESFEELNGGKLVDASKGMIAIGAAIAALGTGTFVGGVLGGIGSLFIDEESGGTPIDKLKEFQEYDLDAPKITKNADAIIAYSNAMSALGSSQGMGGIGSVVAAAADGILGFFGKSRAEMPWDKMVEFGNVTLPTEKIKANSEAVTAYAIAMAKLTTVNVGESFGSMASGIFDGIGEWARGAASLPWDDMMTFAGITFPDTLKTNTERLGEFGEALSKMPEISVRREGGVLGTIATFFSGDVKMPWDALKEFSEVTLDDTQSTNIIKNAELLGKFGEAVSKVPEIPTTTTSSGKFDAIATFFSGDVQMPWDLMKQFSSETFEADKIAANSETLKLFGESLSTIPEIKAFNIDENSVLPWDLLKLLIDSGIAEKSQDIDTAAQTLVNVYDKLKDIPEINITFSEESKDNFDRLTESLNNFSRLQADDILKNIDMLQKFENIPSLAMSTATTATGTQTPDQTVTRITPAPVASNTTPGSTAPVVTTQTTAASTNTETNDIMSLLSYKLDNVISLLETGVTIQDRILLESRS